MKLYWTIEWADPEYGPTHPVIYATTQDPVPGFEQDIYPTFVEARQQVIKHHEAAIQAHQERLQMLEDLTDAQIIGGFDKQRLTKEDKTL